MKVQSCFLLTSIMAITLSGCSYIYGDHAVLHSRDKEYLASQTASSLQVPSGLDGSQLATDYPIPATTSANITATTLPSQLPPNSLAAQIASGKVSKAVLKEDPTKPTATLIQTTGELPYLVYNQTIDRAWNALANALPAAGYRVLEQDRSINTYYILDTSASNGVIQKDSPIYQLRLKAIDDDTSRIDVVDNSGNNLPAATLTPVLQQVAAGLMGKAKSPIHHSFDQWLKQLW